jgi:hypothetical protein
MTVIPPPTKLLLFWDYDTQWGADRSRSGGGPKDWGKLEFDNTDRLLDTLAKYDARACFAVVGAAALPGNRPYHDQAQVKKIHKLGHEVASHSFRHDWLPGLSSADLLETLRLSKDALEQCIGAEVSGFVPPYNQPFDYLRRLSISLAERREARPNRTDLSRLCKALAETGYRFCRVAYRPLHIRLAEAARGRRIDRLAQVERIAGVSCVRINTPGGFDERSMSVLRRVAGQPGAVVAYGHPHSLESGNSQDHRFLCKFLELSTELRKAGKLEFATPKQMAA